MLRVGWAPQGAADPLVWTSMGGPSSWSLELPSIPRRGSPGLCRWLAVRLSVPALLWERPLGVLGCTPGCPWLRQGGSATKTGSVKLEREQISRESSQPSPGRVQSWFMGTNLMSVP